MSQKAGGRWFARFLNQCLIDTLNDRESELERLRTIVSGYEAEMGRLRKTIDQYYREMERLREALRIKQDVVDRLEQDLDRNNRAVA